MDVEIPVEFLDPYRDPTHLRYYTPESLRALAASFGPRSVNVFGEQASSCSRICVAAAASPAATRCSRRSTSVSSSLCVRVLFCAVSEPRGRHRSATVGASAIVRVGVDVQLVAGGNRSGLDNLSAAHDSRAATAAARRALAVRRDGRSARRCRRPVSSPGRSEGSCCRPADPLLAMVAPVLAAEPRGRPLAQPAWPAPAFHAGGQRVSRAGRHSPGRGLRRAGPRR